MSRFATETDYAFDPAGKSTYHDFGYNPALLPSPKANLAAYDSDYQVKFAGSRRRGASASPEHRKLVVSCRCPSGNSVNSAQPTGFGAGQEQRGPRRRRPCGPCRAYFGHTLGVSAQFGLTSTRVGPTSANVDHRGVTFAPMPSNLSAKFVAISTKSGLSSTNTVSGPTRGRSNLTSPVGRFRQHLGCVDQTGVGSESQLRPGGGQQSSTH